MIRTLPPAVIAELIARGIVGGGLSHFLRNVIHELPCSIHKLAHSIHETGRSIPNSPILFTIRRF